MILNTITSEELLRYCLRSINCNGLNVKPFLSNLLKFRLCIFITRIFMPNWDLNFNWSVIDLSIKEVNVEPVAYTDIWQGDVSHEGVINANGILINFGFSGGVDNLPTLIIHWNKKYWQKIIIKNRMSL